MKVLKVITRDIRFPTSKENLGTDAVHVDCDYSAAYVTIETDNKNLSGIGLDRKSTRLNSSHIPLSRMPSSA